MHFEIFCVRNKQKQNDYEQKMLSQTQIFFSLWLLHNTNTEKSEVAAEDIHWFNMK
jgi:hypothetical protein